jgi:hypothetical protein
VLQKWISELAQFSKRTSLQKAAGASSREEVEKEQPAASLALQVSTAQAPTAVSFFMADSNSGLRHQWQQDKQALEAAYDKIDASNPELIISFFTKELRKISLKYHPDKHVGEMKEEATGVFQELRSYFEHCSENLRIGRHPFRKSSTKTMPMTEAEEWPRWSNMMQELWADIERLNREGERKDKEWAEKWGREDQERAKKWEHEDQEKEEYKKNFAIIQEAVTTIFKQQSEFTPNVAAQLDGINIPEWVNKAKSNQKTHENEVETILPAVKIAP